MSDPFDRDYNRVVSALKEAKGLNDERKGSITSGHSATKFDSQIRVRLEQLNVEVQGLERSILKSEGLALTNKEKEKRKTKVVELRAKFNFFRDGVLEEINASLSGENRPSKSKPLRGAEGESDEIRDLSNKELRSQAQNQLKSCLRAHP
eukprot:TRINITY_DN1975_c0_g3_i4.p3 TRINITY_DN1975_c0_g3~~TRINITY_DN1975_c0_g3_i4.p3  ORF type:complete len:150 (-),score=39.94 TRINITY_DN1975_c0_g3_i4:373-822(-)